MFNLNHIKENSCEEWNTSRNNAFEGSSDGSIKGTFDKSILPEFIHKTPIASQRVPVDDLIDTIYQSNETVCCIEGEGGIGKTETLLYLWKQALEKSVEDQEYTPVFFDLKNYRTRTDLLNKLIKYQGNGTFTDWVTFSDFIRSSADRIVLLADGYNEMQESAKDEFLEELKQIKVLKNPLIKVLISSRYLPELCYDGAYEAQRLDEKIIRAYLNKNNIKENEYASVLNFITTPFLLSMYTNNYIGEQENFLGILGQLEFRHEIKNPTDILWNFSRRLIAKKMNEADNARQRQKQYIIWTHIVPFIASQMEKKQIFEFTAEWFDKIIKGFCPGIINSCPETSRYCHALTKNFISPNWNCKDIIDDRENLFRCLCNDAVCYYSDYMSYGFTHQIYRDFFAALDEYNRSFYTIFSNQEFHDKPVLSPNIRYYYYNLFNKEELYSLYDRYKQKKNYLKYSFNKVCNIISDSYYYRDNIQFQVVDYLDTAIKYAKQSADNGDDMSQWNMSYLYRRKFENEPPENTETRERYFNISYNYAKMAEKSGYNEGYDCEAHFYIDPKYDPYLAKRLGLKDTSKLDKYLDALIMLRKAEQKNYGFAYNKHAKLIEQNKITSESPIEEAYYCYRQSAETGDLYAAANMGEYIYFFHNHLKEFNKNQLSSIQAAHKEYKLLRKSYSRIKDTAPNLQNTTFQFTQGFDRILINLGKACFRIAESQREYYKESRLYFKEYLDLIDKKYLPYPTDSFLINYSKSMLLLISEYIKEPSYIVYDENFIELVRTLTDKKKIQGMKNFYLQALSYEQVEHFQLFLQVFDNKGENNNE